MRAMNEKRCSDCGKTVLTRFQGKEFRCLECKPARRLLNARKSYAARMAARGRTVAQRGVYTRTKPVVVVPTVSVRVHDYAFGLWLRGAA